MNLMFGVIETKHVPKRAIGLEKNEKRAHLCIHAPLEMKSVQGILIGGEKG